jgi:hypothetical protein
MAKNKFEEMLERLVNEDREGAEALFHEIVVEKSRDIYQSILESEDDDLEEADDEDLDEASDDEELDEADDEDLDEASDDEELEEMFGLDEFEMEAPMGGDATDDMMGDLDMDDAEGDMDMDMDADDEMGGDVEDRVQDLEDALEELKAEFEAMMGDEDGDDMDDEGDDEGEEEPEEEAFQYESEEDDLEEAKHYKKDDKKEKKTAGEQMREYVEKIGSWETAKGGDEGSGVAGNKHGTKISNTNTKSTVASKNDMGGTTANILRTDTENSGEAGKGHLKGSSLFKGTPKEDNAGNVNVPGAKAGKSGFKKSEPGHGAEKKGKPETADKGAHSTIKGVVRTK